MKPSIEKGGQIGKRGILKSYRAPSPGMLLIAKTDFILLARFSIF